VLACASARAWVHADRRGCREDVLFDAFPWCAHLELDDGEELVVRLHKFSLSLCGSRGGCFLFPLL
jgi:hypothetical protein